MCEELRLAHVRMIDSEVFAIKGLEHLLTHIKNICVSLQMGVRAPEEAKSKAS